MNLKANVLCGSVFLIILFLAPSCRKDFRCACSKVYKSNTGSNVRDYSVKTYRDTRKAADEKCEAQASSGVDETDNYSLSCEIEC